MAAVRIGVTGHRVLADLDAVEQGVGRALGRIRQAYGDAPLLVVSALAEGADRIVAERALQVPRSRLVAVLPLPSDAYVEDFGPPTSASRRAFFDLLQRAAEVHVMPPASSREAAYALAGAYVVEHCDVVLAVWDGQPGQGRGGTGEVVARARALARPLIVVQAGNRKPGTHEPTSLSTAQGQLLVERLAPPAAWTCANG
jgi:hypothetical protein